MSERAYVLDASALLALLLDEPGAAGIAAVLPDACIGAVNLSEVAAKLVERGVPTADVRESFDEIGLDVRPFTTSQALLAGWLRPTTRSAGLSLGDRTCLALAQEIGAAAVTTDTAWRTIDVPVTVQVVERRSAR